MGDRWLDEGFGDGGRLDDELGGEDDWDEGEESLEAELEDGFDVSDDDLEAWEGDEDA